MSVVLISTLLILLSAFETLFCWGNKLPISIFLVNVPMHIKNSWKIIFMVIIRCLYILVWNNYWIRHMLYFCILHCETGVRLLFYKIFKCLIVEIKRLWKLPSMLCVSLTNIILSQSVFLPFGVWPVKLSKSVFNSWHQAFLLFLTIISASSSTHTITHKYRLYDTGSIKCVKFMAKQINEIRSVNVYCSRSCHISACRETDRLAGKGWDEEAHRNTITFPCSGPDKNGAYYQFLFKRKCSGDVFSLEGKWRPDSERSWWPIVSPVISKTNTAAEEQTHDWKQHG